MSDKWATSLTISFILFWMWYGNTSLILISGMMGINKSLYEAADIDGASSWQKFIRITLPLLKPVLLYTLVTSAIGGLQLYDIPALFNTNGGTIGYPDDTSTTVTMYIMRLHSTDTGRAAAVSIHQVKGQQTDDAQEHHHDGADDLGTPDSGGVVVLHCASPPA